MQVEVKDSLILVNEKLIGFFQNGSVYEVGAPLEGIMYNGKMYSLGKKLATVDPNPDIDDETSLTPIYCELYLKALGKTSTKTTTKTPTSKQTTKPESWETRLEHVKEFVSKYKKFPTRSSKAMDDYEKVLGGWYSDTKSTYSTSTRRMKQPELRKIWEDEYPKMKAIVEGK